MSIRTIIEINHDLLPEAEDALMDLLQTLHGSWVAGALNRSDGKPVQWDGGIRILAQRSHSTKIKLEVS